MNTYQSGSPAEARRAAAKRLVAGLRSAELVLLIGLVGGMSIRTIAARSSHSPEDVEITLASLMKKLKAGTIADAVRIGLYAGVDRSD